MNEQLATRRMIARQMKENTGASFLDSGDAYGRNHERNRKKGVKFGQGLRIDDCGATIPVQDYMEHCFLRTSRAAAMEKTLRKMIAKAYPEGEPVCLSYYEGGAISDALDELGATNAPGDSGKPKWWNTYNDETDLSQTLQMLVFHVGGTTYAIVQVHGGCDVRGGYTNGRIYEVPDYYRLFDVRAEVELPDGNGHGSLYYAQERHGLKWGDEKWVWPDGSEAYFHAAAIDGY